MTATDCTKKISVQQGKLLYLRLRHVSLKHLKMLYPNIDTNSFKNSFICTKCPVAKQIRKSFYLSTTKTTRPFYTLHLDV